MPKAAATAPFDLRFEFEPDDAYRFRHDEQALLVNPRAEAMALVDAARCRAHRIEKIILPFVSLPLDAAERLDGRDLFGLLLTLSGINQEVGALIDASLTLMNEQRGAA